MRTCGDCLFMTEVPDISQIGKPQIVCVRFPPTILGFPLNGPQGIVMHMMTAYPTVNKESPSCGEYEKISERTVN